MKEGVWWKTFLAAGSKVWGLCCQLSISSKRIPTKYSILSHTICSQQVVSTFRVNHNKFLGMNETVQLWSFTVWETEDFKRNRTNGELRCSQKVWYDWKLHLKLEKKTSFLPSSGHQWSFHSWKAKFPEVEEKYCPYSCKRGQFH
jgi:hypothetical protein